MPRPYPDWSKIVGLENRIEALMENTDQKEFILMVHPDDEEQAKRTLRRLGYKDIRLETNPQLQKGTPILTGRQTKEGRSTGAGREVVILEAPDIARLWHEAENKEAGDGKPWNQMSQRYKTQKTNVVRALIMGRAIQPGQGM